jgi:hypothetical protein
LAPGIAGLSVIHQLSQWTRLGKAEAANGKVMFSLDMNARPASRAAKQFLSFKLLKLLARRRRARPVAFDHAEIERFKLELEMKRAHMSMLSRLKVM